LYTPFSQPVRKWSTGAASVFPEVLLALLLMAGVLALVLLAFAASFLALAAAFFASFSAARLDGFTSSAGASAIVGDVCGMYELCLLHSNKYRRLSHRSAPQSAPIKY
jgi:predicted phage tail protein